jgi:hypothetical protein
METSMVWLLLGADALAGVVGFPLVFLFFGVIIYGMRAREVPALAWCMVAGREQQDRLQGILTARKSPNAVR